ncbi:hypothetical protein EUX98_g3429 [Antrodiella citrinella]|uniref:ABM domain-containing protein n=1 Tax=Antrodiella citrinella TaxID=2447956 RepID=A0A4S4MWK0_9APHY|nr:hypothetical protein EUX98_g3429 [Antrodiella citrinella]
MSSEIVVEVATFKASEAYKADPTVFHPALNMVAASKGVLHIWHGLEHEDRSTVYFLVAWEKVSDHHTLMNDPEYSNILTVFAAVAAGPVNLRHVAFKSITIPLAHFAAPFTEVSILTVKEGKSNTGVESILWDTKINQDGAAFTTGKTVEKDNEYVSVKGWESIEAHEAAAADPQIKALIEVLEQTVKMELAHVQLTAFNFKF